MKILGNIIKSRSDKRLYQAIKLNNDLECLIISDQESKKSSAALSVGVGSLQDPMEAQGLAHYLEHMLFMGTKKYPDENDYSSFIAKNSGVSNAYTAQDLTNYHFEVSSNAFEDTLDRFAQFFVSPLMSDSSSQRQLNAVHSEHVKNLQNDMWRKYQLSKTIAKDGHPLKKFSTGNLASLSSPNLRQMLHKFYDSKYSSNLMKLVVCSNQSPEYLSKLIEEKFSEVSNKKYIKYQMLDSPYGSQSFGKLYKIVPIKDNKSLELVWTLPNKSQYYENHPGKYLSHLFGHQGKGSLLSFLMGQGLAFGLSAHSSDSFNSYNQFQVSISLTKKGVQSYNAIIQYILYFLDTLKGSKPEQWVFSEIKKVNQMKFNFLQKKQGMMFTSGLARKLQEQKIEQVIAYPYFMKEWKPELIEQYLTEMNNQNLMVFLQAKQVQQSCNLVEQIYSTKYGIQQLKATEPLQCNVSLPGRNPYIPTDFSLAKNGTLTYPTKIVDTSSFQGYFKQDHKFGLPKINLLLKIYFDGTQNSRFNIARKIYIDMLHEKMRQFTYLGDAAQISSGVDFSNHYSVSIGLSGFRDSVQKFTPQFLEKIMNFQPDDLKLFERTKEKFERIYQNYFLGDPFRMAYTTMQLVLKHGADVAPKQKLAQIKSIQFEDILNFSRIWKKQLSAQSILTGNIEQKDAQKIFNDVQILLNKYSQPLPSSKLSEIRPVKLSNNFVSVIQEDLTSTNQQNSALIVHFQNSLPQLSSKDHNEKIHYHIKQSLLQELCYNFIKEPAFDYLRTKQQLGYIVMCLPDDNRGVAGMSILVQSAIKTSYQLVEYIEIFLQKILKDKLSQLDAKLFSQYKQSLKISKQQSDKTLQQQTSRFWSEIMKHQFIFDRNQREIQEIDKITIDHFKEYIESSFYRQPKRLQVHLKSQNQKDKNEKLKAQRLSQKLNVKIFKDAETLKKTLEIYPDIYCKL